MFPNSPLIPCLREKLNAGAPSQHKDRRYIGTSPLFSLLPPLIFDTLYQHHQYRIQHHWISTSYNIGYQHHTILDRRRILHVKQRALSQGYSTTLCRNVGTCALSCCRCWHPLRELHIRSPKISPTPRRSLGQFVYHCSPCAANFPLSCPR